MIVLAALLLAAAPAGTPPAETEATRYRSCLESAGREPDKAIPEATKWIGGGGGVPARHCLALAYLAQHNYGPAALGLAAAAREATTKKDPHVGELWGQAGNASMLGGKYDVAVGYFTSALASIANDPTARAEVLIDRARAYVELKRVDEAHADLAEATKLEPGSPFGWLLRATLARRQGDLAGAESSLLEAVRRAPDDPDVELEAGNIAAAKGQLTLARQAWASAASNAPGSPAAIAATQALAQNPEK